MSAFTHLILTRFNVRIKFGEKVGFGAAHAPDKAWLDHRFQIFEGFCLPSLQAQTVQNFKWLVFFDGQTPEEYRERIRSYEPWNAFIPFFVPVSYPEFLREDFYQVILEHVEPESEFLITTRLDNDDAVNIRFVQAVQDQLRGQDQAFVNFPRGYLLNLKSNKLYLALHYSNPFSSLIEPIDSFRTILGRYHNLVQYEERVMQVDTRPIWLQVIHGRNVSNRIRFQERVPRKALGTEFAISAEFKSEAENLTTLALENKLNRIMRQAMAFFRRSPAARRSSR